MRPGTARPSTRLLAAALAASLAPRAAGSDPWAAPRAEMVRTIEAIARDAAAYTGRAKLDPRVLSAMGEVPRHLFVPEPVRDLAYRDRPLPIGEGQTISQPFTVAIMTDLARVKPGDRVLEIGTGSGYQAAVLARLCRQVFTIEIVERLGREAAARLERLGFAGVEVRIGDGYLGWPERAPFDAIVVTAGADHVPPPLVEQLAPGGRLVIPVGEHPARSELLLVEKLADGTTRRRAVLPVAFVPLTRGPPR